MEESSPLPHSPTMVKGFATRPQASEASSCSKARPALDAAEVQQQWLSYFESLEDPRGRQGCEHSFVSIVLIAILAVIGGADGWEDIELYAISHQKWLETFLELGNGVPHADTYRRVFARIKPQGLQECFSAWINHLAEQTGAQVIAIDGKCMRGSYDRSKKQPALHIVSAWASENRLMLGQVKVSAKSNEITAIPALLELLDMSGCIITIDAMGTQTKIASQINECGADYVLNLKNNHPTLHNQVEEWFQRAQANGFEGVEHDYDRRVESGHHRIETREIWAVAVSEIGPLYGQQDWAGLETIVMVVRTRRLWNKTTHEMHFYLSSLPCDAQVIGRAIRSHWGIENQLHWVLDVTFAEDDSRIRRGYGAENFTLLRRMAIGLLNQETSAKRSTKQKRKLAGMSDDYMIQVLAGATAA